MFKRCIMDISKKENFILVIREFLFLCDFRIVKIVKIYTLLIIQGEKKNTYKNNCSYVTVQEDTINRFLCRRIAPYQKKKESLKKEVNVVPRVYYHIIIKLYFSIYTNLYVMDRIKKCTQYRKRRKFHGNQFSKKVKYDTVEENQEVVHENLSLSEASISSSKIQEIQTSTPKQEDPFICGNRIIDMEILSNIISILCCPECTKPCLKLSERFSHKKGLSSLLVISCECGYKHDFYTSSSCGKSYDINRRTVYTMRACGQGYRGIENFCALMNMPRPMTNRCYDKIVTTVSNSAQLVAEETMEDAAKEIRNFSDNTEIVDNTVSCDGSWQRRGYSSLNGVVTVISMTMGKSA